MGRSRYSFGALGAPCLMICTMLDWTPVFTRRDTVEIVPDSIRFLQRDSDLKVYGHVILEDPMHWIAQSQGPPSDVQRHKSGCA